MAKYGTMPGRYIILVDVEPTQGFPEGHTYRFHTTGNTLEEVRAIIAHNEHDLRNTFGGLIDPGKPAKRKYRIFEATYKQVDL